MNAERKMMVAVIKEHGVTDERILEAMENKMEIVMFIILLKFSENKSKAGDHMDGHNQWIKQGFEDGVFLLAGSLPVARGCGAGRLAPARARGAGSRRVCAW